LETWLHWVHSSHLKGWDTDIIGYVASALVLATFSMKSMRPLRLIAVASNVAFISYALIADMRPILILHSILLPVNIVRLLQMELAPLWRGGGRSTFAQPLGED
jgi:hypothetical protein